jgi:hypothetical protein
LSFDDKSGIVIACSKGKEKMLKMNFFPWELRLNLCLFLPFDQFWTLINSNDSTEFKPFLIIIYV